MNLIEARKQAYEGWVRSPSVTKGYWRRIRHNRYWYSELGTQIDGITLLDIEAEDWEPKPAPEKPREWEVWVNPSGTVFMLPLDTGRRLAELGWRKIRVREVLE